MRKPPPRKSKLRKKRRTLDHIRGGKGKGADRLGKQRLRTSVGKTRVAKAPDRVHFVSNFRHIDLSDYAHQLPLLEHKPDHLLLFSEKTRNAVQYYLSTLNAVKQKFAGSRQSWPISRTSYDPKTVELLKGASHEIPALSSFELSEATSLLSGGYLTRQSPVLVHVKNAKPAKLVVSLDHARQSELSPNIKIALLNDLMRDARQASAASQGSDEPPLFSKDFEGFGPVFPTAGAAASSSKQPATSASSMTSAASGVSGTGSGHQPQPGDVTQTPAPTKQKDKLPFAALLLPVYPDILIADDHPVQGSRFNVTVSLGFNESQTTPGVVQAPADENPHCFDVHLLLGKTSRWGKLEFQRPMGTTAAAEFIDVQAPILDGSEETINGHPVFDIYVNFYLENRWCGEALRRIEVLPGVGSPRLAVLQTPEAPAWRKNLHVSPGTEPPDLLIRIKNTRPFDFEWTLLSPFMNFRKDASIMHTILTDPPYRFVKDTFDEKFSGSDLNDQQITELEESCNGIFQIAPQGFHEAYREFCAEVAGDSKKRFHTIQFVSDEAFIPWELMRVSDPSYPPAFPPEILGVKHSVGRWLASDSSELTNRLEIKKIAVSASDYKTLNAANLPPLDWVAAERRFLESAPYSGTDVPLQLQCLTDFLKQGSAEIVHLSCHGDTDVDAPQKATLWMEDKPLKATKIATPEVRAGVGRSHPLVFLNACQAALTGQFLGMVFGWPQAFLQMGATACIAPLWKVNDKRARTIAEEFYTGALASNDGGTSPQLGEVLRRIRARWKDQKSLTYLGYILYGDPTTVLNWKSPTPVASATSAIPSAPEVTR